MFLVDFDKMFSVAELKKDSDVEPPVKDGFGEFGDLQLVGHGEQTNPYCGMYAGLKGCLNVEKHNKAVFDKNGALVNCSGKIFRRIIRNSCNRPSCPVCYISWAMREAKKIAFILGEASKQHGKVEHILISVPVQDYDLDYKALRRKVIKVAKDRGIIGGSIICHAFRYNRIKKWYLSIHFHILGFIFGGYGKCRYCKRKNNCLAGCGGFDDVSWRKFQKDRYYVKVLDPLHERRNVRKTASYELGHCTIKKNVRNFRAVTYFGVASYRKLKISAEARARFEESRRQKCELCGSELVDIRYLGSKPFVTDRLSPDFKRDSFENYLENGSVAYVKKIKRKWSSASYEG